MHNSNLIHSKELKKLLKFCAKNDLFYYFLEPYDLTDNCMGYQCIDKNFSIQLDGLDFDTETLPEKELRLIEILKFMPQCKSFEFYYRTLEGSEIKTISYNV
jgi:hypothetical protein